MNKSPTLFTYGTGRGHYNYISFLSKSIIHLAHSHIAVVTLAGVVFGFLIEFLRPDSAEARDIEPITFTDEVVGLTETCDLYLPPTAGYTRQT